MSRKGSKTIIISPRLDMATQTSIVIANNKTLATTTNNNPVIYTHKFHRPLRDVTKITLLRSSIPASSLITLIVVSDWVASSTGVEVLVDTTVFHQMAVRMSAAIGKDPNTSNYVATISNPAGTVDLMVHDVFTRIGVRSDLDYKTYDVLLCTGTVSTSTFTDWTITAEGEDPDVPITPTTSSVLTVQTHPQPALLRLRLNGDILGRVQQSRTTLNQWLSYAMYSPGDIVIYGANKFVCTQKHLSLVFDDDLAALCWNQLTTALWTTGTLYSIGTQIQYSGSIYICTVAHTSGSFSADLNAHYWNWGAYVPSNDASVESPVANDAFEVFYFGGDTQSINNTVYLPNHIQYDMRIPSLHSITFEWFQCNGKPFMFPYKPFMRITSLDSADSYTLEREYLETSLHLQITHGAYWQ